MVVLSAFAWPHLLHVISWKTSKANWLTRLTPLPAAVNCVFNIYWLSLVALYSLIHLWSQKLWIDHQKKKKKKLQLELFFSMKPQTCRYRWAWHFLQLAKMCCLNLPKTIWQRPFIFPKSCGLNVYFSVATILVSCFTVCFPKCI